MTVCVGTLEYFSFSDTVCTWRLSPTSSINLSCGRNVTCRTLLQFETWLGSRWNYLRKAPLYCLFFKKNYIFFGYIFPWEVWHCPSILAQSNTENLWETCRHLLVSLFPSKMLVLLDLVGTRLCPAPLHSEIVGRSLTWPVVFSFLILKTENVLTQEHFIF